MKSDQSTVRVYSIFYSIQGESTWQGLPCIFVRLAGCPLKCSYCDTRAACEAPGTEMTFEEILNQIRSFPCSLVELTGGEPLAQPGAFPLMSALCDRGYNVLVETSGAVPIRGVDHRVRVIMDIKTPGSNMAGRFLDENIQSLIPGDHQVKFVVTSRADFDFALEKISMYHLSDKVDLLISPVFGANGAEVAEWILESGLPLRLQLQLHRVLWPSTDSETADGRER